ncbi:MAG TPA: hypothetical protein PLZ43_14045 [bacterium]|nr:hypothetical protein [bacterium]
MSNSSKRFIKRKKIKEQIKNNSILYIPNEAIVESIKRSEINENLLNEIQKIKSDHLDFNFDFKVDDDELDFLLNDIEKEYDIEKIDGLIEECKNQVIDNIVKPFGLGQILSKKYDKDGGNVTTINNAKQGVYANEKDKYKRKEYETTKNSKEVNFKNNKNPEYKKNLINKSKSGKIKDNYTGEEMLPKDMNLDHIYSLSQYHKEGGYMQDNKKKADFATDENNFAMTSANLNKSKRDKDGNEWKESTAKGQEKCNKKRYKVDDRRLKPAIEKSQKVAKKHLPTDSEKVWYYSCEIGKTSVKEGAQMGLQQSIGLLLRELAIALIDEVKDIYKNGFYTIDQSFFNEIKMRFTKISEKTLEKWKDVVKAFGEGTISGILSNLVTTIINMFLTTAKNIVRIIREGFLSIIRAIKFYISPPEHISKQEAAHEASKLIGGALVVTIGIALEDSLEKIIASFPPLTPFANYISSFTMGVISGIATAVVVYQIDKLDFFGVERQKRHEYIMKKLAEINFVSDEEINELLTESSLSI